MAKLPFRTKRYIVLAPHGGGMINAIGDTISRAHENAIHELGNQFTVDKLNSYGYRTIEVELVEVTRK